MIWERIKSNWNHYKSGAREQWNALSEEQLTSTEGSRPLLASRIQEAYGLSAEDAEKQLAGWQALQTDREPSLLRRRT